MKIFILIKFTFIMLFLNACSNNVEVILLPDSNNKVGKVTVKQDKKEILLDKAWQKVNSSNLDKKEILSPKEIKKEYKELFDAMPIASKNYKLYFGFDSSKLTNKSKKTLKEIIKEIKSNNIIQIDVIGYTDRAGDKGYNKKLSMRRAKNVIALLKQANIDEQMIFLDYYGEANPLIKTADGVAKKENRRVEITIK